jgi:hypothetical protein
MFLELALTLPIALVPQQSANPRYELGLRTRALERAWIAATPELRARVLPQVEGAVQRFFAMDMAGVGAALDEARTKLERSDKPWDLERFTLTPARKLLDVTDTSVKLTLGNLYTTDFAAPGGAHRELRRPAAQARAGAGRGAGARRVARGWCCRSRACRRARRK